MKYIAHHAMNNENLNNTIKGIRIASKRSDRVEIDLIYDPIINNIFISHDFPVRKNANLFLDLTQECSLKLMLDLKCENLNIYDIYNFFLILRKQLKLMKQHDIILATFNHTLLMYLKKLKSKYTIGLISDKVNKYDIECFESYVSFFSLNYNHINLNLLVQIKNHKKDIYLWDVPRHKEAKLDLLLRRLITSLIVDMYLFE